METTDTSKRNGTFTAMKSISWLFGPLMFLCGLVLIFIERIPPLLQLFHGSADEAERTAVAIVVIILSFAMMTIAGSHAEIQQKLTLLAELSGFFDRQEKRLETANVETNILRSLARIYHKAPPNKIHLLAGIRVLQQMHELNVGGNFRRMEDLGQEKAKKAILEDKSLAFMFLKEILELLPANGVWFGVTHLTSRQVWVRRQANEEFDLYRRNMWARAMGKTIQVFRIYYFSNSRDFQQMKSVLQEESENGVVVKYIVSGTDFPPDMSLLWSPLSPPSELELTADKIQNLTVNGMKGMGFTPICGIEFEVKSTEQLNEVNVNDPDSDEFRILLNKFTNAWSRPSCKSWPARTQGEPSSNLSPPEHEADAAADRGGDRASSQ